MIKKISDSVSHVSSRGSHAFSENGSQSLMISFIKTIKHSVNRVFEDKPFFQWSTKLKLFACCFAAVVSAA